MEHASEGKTKREQDGLCDEGGGEKVGMVNEVECWQRIISMTSKGVVISRCFSPSLPRTASGEPPPRDCINSSRPLRPSFPFTPHSPFCSASSSHLTLPLRGPPVSTSSLPKHNFRGQTKRVGVAYNEARSFVSSAFSCYPFSCPAQRCPCRRLNLNSD